MKQGFTLIELMISSILLLLIIMGFSKIVDQTLSQILLHQQNAEMASQLDEWSRNVLKQGGNSGTLQESLQGSNLPVELKWQMTETNSKWKSIEIEVFSPENLSVVLTKWKTAVKVP